MNDNLNIKKTILSFLIDNNNNFNNNIHNTKNNNQKRLNLLKIFTYWCCLFLICDNSCGSNGIIVNGYENNNNNNNINNIEENYNSNFNNNKNNIIIDTKRIINKSTAITATLTTITTTVKPSVIASSSVKLTTIKTGILNAKPINKILLKNNNNSNSNSILLNNDIIVNDIEAANLIKSNKTIPNNKKILNNIINSNIINKNKKLIKKNFNNNNETNLIKKRYDNKINRILLIKKYNKIKNKIKRSINNNKNNINKLIFYNNYYYNKLNKNKNNIKNKSNRIKRHSGDLQIINNNNNYNNKNKDLNTKMLQRPDFYDDEDLEDDIDDSYELLLRNSSAQGMFIGAACNGTCHSDLAHVYCDPSTLTCGCDKNHPVIIGLAKGCAKSKRLGQQCHYHESCLYNDENSLCIQIKHNAMCQCKDGYHMVSYTKPIKKKFCTRDMVLVNSDLPTLLGVVAGIFVLAGLICMVLHLFSKTKYPRRPFRDTNPSPTILYNSNDTGIPLTVRSGRPSSRSSFHSSDSLGSYGNRRPSSALQSGSKGILVSTSRTGSRRASLTSIHSVPSIRSYSAMRFEKELQQKEIRQEMKIRLGQLQQEHKSKDSLHPPSEGF
ncbi:putative uncharacterized protein DDB_G0282133 isoform X2 [Condylostylus longicornis]|uniref:putative uncharacterized protein DDB_G0282133 isoform X2 n=1 Tax=Condylostylus longicornis TaxID=2530218 RepID=UPI00244DD5C0|nr:putative uncharacterized protein DDB_G0282133 isoform X2 [Condylostylus longicornis]